MLLLHGMFRQDDFFNLFVSYQKVKEDPFSVAIILASALEITVLEDCKLYKSKAEFFKLYSALPMSKDFKHAHIFNRL